MPKGKPARTSVNAWEKTAFPPEIICDNDAQSAEIGKDKWKMHIYLPKEYVKKHNIEILKKDRHKYTKKNSGCEIISKKELIFSEFYKYSCLSLMDLAKKYNLHINTVAVYKKAYQAMICLKSKNWLCVKNNEVQYTICMSKIKKYMTSLMIEELIEG